MEVGHSIPSHVQLEGIIWQVSYVGSEPSTDRQYSDCRSESFVKALG